MLLHIFRKHMQNFLVSQNTSPVTEKRNILSIWERIKMNWEALTIWYCNIIEDSFLFIMTSFPSQVPFWKKAFTSSLLVQLGFQDLSKDKYFSGSVLKWGPSPILFHSSRELSSWLFSAITRKLDILQAMTLTSSLKTWFKWLFVFFFTDATNQKKYNNKTLRII